MGLIKHGMTRRHHQWHPLYVIWSSMKQRCENPNHPAFKRYGGRGILVCVRWRESFVDFLADMGPRPDSYTIERIDNDAGYSPENCRWASRTEQARNKAPAFTYMSAEAAEASKQRCRDAAIRANTARTNPPKVCLHCGGEYRRQGYTAEWHKPKYCSQACYVQARLTPTRPCGHCGELFRGKRRVRTARFCSLSCSAQHREETRRASK